MYKKNVIHNGYFFFTKKNKGMLSAGEWTQLETIT